MRRHQPSERKRRFIRPGTVIDRRYRTRTRARRISQTRGAYAIHSIAGIELVTCGVEAPHVLRDRSGMAAGRMAVAALQRRTYQTSSAKLGRAKTVGEDCSRRDACWMLKSTTTQGSVEPG